MRYVWILDGFLKFVLNRFHDAPVDVMFGRPPNVAAYIATLELKSNTKPNRDGKRVSL